MLDLVTSFFDMFISYYHNTGYEYCKILIQEASRKKLTDNCPLSIFLESLRHSRAEVVLSSN